MGWFSKFFGWIGGLFSSSTPAPAPAPAATGPTVQPPSPAAPAPVVKPVVSAFPWLDWLHANKGQPMVTGKKASAFEIMVFSHTTDDNVAKTGIEESGCAATQCAALELNGYKSPHRADAKSFAKYGEECELKVGALVVYQHHVTCCDSINPDGSFQGIGGNQGSPASLCIERFTKSSLGGVIGIRWPVKA